MDMKANFEDILRDDKRKNLFKIILKCESDLCQFLKL